MTPSTGRPPVRRVYVTGGSGFLGRSVVRALAHQDEAVEHVVSADLRPPAGRPLARVVYETGDVTDHEAIDARLRRHRIDTVVHLASIVTPGRHTTPAQQHAVDVDGTRNVLESCVAAGVRRIVVSSSGAAYGYHADNPAWIVETDPLRGNDAFAYSRHKRLVEEMLAAYRHDHPGLEQTVFRIGTILGSTVDNQITALFQKRSILKIRGASSPFVFAWDEDVVAAMVVAVLGGATGTFNVAGDGAVTIDEIAGMLGRPTLTVPAGALKAVLAVGRRLGLTVHGPEQTDFLRYRPVLSNTALKEEFGFTPRFTSRQAFRAWMLAR